MYKKLFIALFYCIISLTIKAQSQQSFTDSLAWVSYSFTSDQTVKRPVWCTGCKEYMEGNWILPKVNHLIPLGNSEITDIQLVDLQSTASSSDFKGLELATEYGLDIQLLTIRGVRHALLSILPVRRTGNKVALLQSFRIDYQTVPSEHPRNAKHRNKKDQTYTSVLSTGVSYKISVSQSGVHRLDRDFFTSNNLDITNLKLSKFNIYGNGGAMLPEIIAANRAEDLQKNKLYIHDANGNDELDLGDYILWYAQGPHAILYNTGSKVYSYVRNDFEDQAYYFLKWGQEATAEMSSITSGQGTSINLSLTTYDHIIHHEVDEINHIHSGRIWWGDEMSGSQTVKNFDYTVSGLTNKPIRLQAVTSARSLASSVVTIGLNGSNSNSFHNAVSGEFDANYTAGSKTTIMNVAPSGQTIHVSFNYSRPLSDSKAWIDYFTLTTERNLEAGTDQRLIMSSQSLLNGNVAYRIANFTDQLLWDVTDLSNVRIQETYADGTKQVFISSSTDQELKRYQLFKLSAAHTPEYLGTVEQQNLHGLSEVEYIIITHPAFVSQAEQLAQFHRDYSGLAVEVVTVGQIYNEFSSGSQDVTGIRDFAKLIYDRGLAGTKELKYLLLFGDASYDHKNRIENNTNYVPIYQSFNSYIPAASHCSDDYYAILDDNEGYWGIGPAFEGLDIGVGRLPVSSAAQADLIVDKIIHYHKGSFGDWVNKMSFLGDDEDNNVHFNCSEYLSSIIETQEERMNINKIYLDAHEQVSFGSGNKYPTVNAEVDKVIDQGSLIFNYVGHGGTNGMSHERVVTRPMISAWKNYDKLSFYITASCELAAVDNPAQSSPGELMLFNPNGGAIGMVATTRVVYIGANCDLNQEILNSNIFEIVDHKSKAFGEVYRDTRNASSTGNYINKRSFMLFADPAMGLLTPPHQVVTTEINGQPYASFSDTLKALSKVTITGEIRDYNNTLMNNFNGVLFPTIYDKKASYQTRANDPGSYVSSFDVQNSVIYRGQISVIDGAFSFSFIIPKDIAYQYGTGKLSYYAHDKVEHAGGVETDLIIGGTSDSLLADDTPPELKLYIDDRSWVFGGTTGFTPLLLADISDSSGINTIGSGIGREMEAVLDEGTENEQVIVLNEYFQPALNSYQLGEINYRFADLEAGRHTIRLKVWDVYNNSAEAYTEFVVGDQSELQIDHLLNYPNPFNKFTSFHFDHNKAGQNLDINLKIYTIAGNVVYHTSTTLANAPSHSSELNWDGRDQFGDPLARGVYLYEFKVRAEDGSTQKQTQKLFIIR